MAHQVLPPDEADELGGDPDQVGVLRVYQWRAG